MNSRRTVVVTLVVLLVFAIAGLVLTSEWVMPSLQRTQDPRGRLLRVDQRQLTTAENLAALATTNREREYAQEALRLADQDVDLAFSIALRHATDQPAKPAPQARELAARVAAATARVAAAQKELARLDRIGGAEDKQRSLAAAQLALDQDELAEAQRAVARAGGDDVARLQRALDAHEKSLTHANANALAPPAVPGSGVSVTRSGYAEFKYWLERHDLCVQLKDAQQDARTRAADLVRQRGALQAGLEQEHSAASADDRGVRLLEQIKLQRRDLSDLEKRADVQQSLAEAYGNWSTSAKTREYRSLHRLIMAAFWIVLVLLLATFVDHVCSRLFRRFTTDGVRLHTLRAIVLFASRATAALIILLIVFGRPSQMSTAMALAGAGLTVALKDFIVGFFGWFVLIGRNGVRPGDWVEINGVQGKVLELGLLFTVILETGNWTVAGHPTGRKVTFVNSYAIEGHYFNFSTTSQWLWDELQVGLPASADPYPIVDAVRQIVEAQTAEGSRQAEQEWHHAALVSGLSRLSAVPSVSIRTTDVGFNVTVRYVARADERVQTRSHLNRAIFDVLAQRHVLPEVTTVAAESPETTLT